MKRLLLLAIWCTISVSLNSQCASNPTNHAWPWDAYDGSQNVISVSSAFINHQLNGQAQSNCHGYAWFQAVGNPVPTSASIPNGDLTGCFSKDIALFSSTINHTDFAAIYEANIIDQSLISEITNPADYELATHIVWFDSNPFPVINCNESRMFNNDRRAVHSAIPSQFRDFPYSEGWVQSANSFGPGVYLHSIDQYTCENSGQNNTPSFTVKYYIYKPAVPLISQPNTPSSTFSCGAFVVNEPSCNNATDGFLRAVNSSSVNGIYRTYSWSNNPNNNSNDNPNVTAGTYTVTVTEGPTNYVCTAAVTASPQPLVSSFSYTAHASGQNCIGFSGTGSATVNLISGLNPNNFSFQWDANANSQTSQTATGLCNGTYSVTITDNNPPFCSEVHQAVVPIGFGGFRISKPNSFNEELTKLNVQLINFSNSILISGQAENSQAIIYDLQGRIISNAILSEARDEIDISTIPNGLYIINVINPAGELLYNEKITLNQ